MKTPSKTSKPGKAAPQYKRGFTAQSQHSPETRPEKLVGRTYNDFYPRPRSAVMPPPTEDTQEPRLSKRTGKGLSKGKGRR